LKFFNIDDIRKTYEYRSGDIVYYNVLGYPLEEGLRFISFDHNVVEMVANHIGHDLVVLYIVMYGIVDVVVERDVEEDSEYERAVVFRNDAFWDSILSDDTDCLDSNEDSTCGYGDIDDKVGNDEDAEVRRKG
jgi:hypothetical protein